MEQILLAIGAISGFVLLVVLFIMLLMAIAVAISK